VKSRYVEEQASRLREEFAVRGLPEVVAQRTYTARLLGQETSLVLHGGGNTSAKGTEKDAYGETVEVLYVKGSGWDLETIDAPGHPAVRLEPLRRLRKLSQLTDEQMVNELRLALLDASAPNPSVETLLHAWLPARFVDHTHADAVLALADQPNAEKLCKQLFGKGLVWVPYVMPGFELAKRCSDAFEALQKSGTEPEVIVLAQHGIFTFGETAKESYERMIAAVTRAERYVADSRPTVSISPPKRIAGIEESILVPRVRGVLARLAGEPPEQGPFLTFRSPDTVVSFLEMPNAPDLIKAGCATPDHVIRTKPTALYVANPDYSDLGALSKRLEEEIAQYAYAYDAYFQQMCAEKKVSPAKLDPWPRVILLPGAGILAVGRSLKEADAVADIYEHTVNVMIDAADVGRYAPVSRSDLFDLEYWSLEQAKIKKTTPLALEKRIAIVTGAASGIGAATAARLLELGAHVALLDRDAKGLVEVHGTLAQKYGSTRTIPVVCDVISWKKVSAAIHSVISFFGGLDIVVSNAGIAPEGRLDSEAGDEALRASLDANLLSHNHVARAATEVMLAQGTGGVLLFNASKSAFNPGPNFGPYAVAKSALVALTKQYAIDLGRYGIRANCVNADRVRTQLFAGNVAESRASARGLSVDEYFRANLLSREVDAKDVADAFAYLAQARATTGCVVTVDGGNAAAFPR
jgi:rhamnose utilization protein RhaD (predicted bifunctional aldolase and dehydrogenase)/NAD(P)-dependent dehydrogenase (short-subunit alcohol dehydrogenase family)